MAVPGGGGGGEGRDSNNNHILRFPPFPGHLFQEPWESPLSIGQQLASGGAQPPAVATEVGAAVRGVEKGGSGYPDLGANSRGGGSGSSVVWVVDVGADTAHWGASGRIPPQGGLQDYGTESSDREGWWVIIYPAGGSDGGFRVTGGGDLRLPPLENSHTVHCDQAHYGPVSLGGEAFGFTGGQSLVGTRRLGLGRYADGSLGGRTDGGGVVDVCDGDRGGINRWEDTVANVILGTDPHAPLSYAMGLEIHHLIMTMIVGH